MRTEAGQVCLDHPAYDVLEADGRRPAQIGPDPGRVAGQGLRVDRAEQRRVDVDVRRPVVDADAAERRGDELLHRVALARGHHVVAGDVGAGGSHHRVDEVRGPAPVAHGGEVAEGEPRGGAGGDRGHAGGDLAGHELLGPARGLVVVEDQARPRAGLGGGRRRPSGGRRPSRRRTGSPGGPGCPRPAGTGRGGRRSPRWTPGRSRTGRPARSCSRRADSSSPTAARPLTRAVRSGSSQDRATELTAARL